MEKGNSEKDDVVAGKAEESSEVKNLKLREEDSEKKPTTMEKTEETNKIENENLKENDSIKISNRLLLGILIGAVVVIIAFFAINGNSPVTGNAIQSGSATTLSDSDTAAIVNGEIITVGELNKAFNSLPPQYQGTIDKATLLNQLVQTKVIYQEAKRRGFTVSNEEAKKEFDALKLSSGLSDEQLSQTLQAQGITEEELIDQHAKRLAIQNFLNESFLSKIKVSDKEVKDFYKENSEQFKVGEQVTVKHILIGDSEMTPEEQNAKAAELLPKLTKSNFCDFVTNYSTDTASISTCGEYEFTQADPYVEEFKNFSFSQKIGEMGIVQTKFGSHIIWTVKKTPAKTLSLNEVKNELKDTLRTQKEREQSGDFYRELSKNSKIEIKFKG